LINTFISVIIPTFNRSSFLTRSINSVLNQTYNDFKLIVVDDGSIDNTNDLINSNYQNIIYLHQNNKGVSSARNLGINTTQSEWIAFLDSDDEWHPKKLELQIKELKKNPSYFICHTNEKWIKNGKHLNQKNKHQKYGGWIFDKCLSLCCVSPSSIIIHNSVFKNCGIFDENFPVCEDYELWLRISSKYKFLYLQDKLITKYGGHSDQLSTKYWGMDRFRIEALYKLIDVGKLSFENLKIAKKMLNHKTKIYTDGALKRGKMDEAQNYLNRLKLIN
tara:strand:+ start:1435 stop:2262 length:828 start_codon:yes stop_codon:yes gene_type:complete